MKMSDIFELPMTQGITCVMSKDHRHEIVFDESDSNVSDQIEHVAHAINNHDRMMEELKSKTDMLALVVEEKSRMTEEIAELKRAIEAAMRIKELWLPTCEFSVDPPGHYREIEALHKMANKFEKALAKLKQEGED